MKFKHSLLASAVLALSLSACDSDTNDIDTIPGNEGGGSSSPSNDPLTGSTAGDTTGTVGSTDGAVTAGGDDGVATAGGTDGSATAGGTDGAATAGGTDGSSDAGAADGGNMNITPPVIDDVPRIDPENLPPASPPALDPLAQPVASPAADDPFGSRLEMDTEEAVAGGPPTQPKNLRLDLVSNNWAEFSWAPSNDDGEVVQYNIYRSDGVIYEVREDQTDIASGTQEEIAKIWQTTSFIDCNYTRFAERLHRCNDNTPEPGSTYQYEVTAIDDDGQESSASEPLSITYLAETNAAVPLYRDLYKGEEDRFASETDLSAVDYWLEEFDLVFADEFNGDSVDADKWQTGLTWGDSRIINGEQQYFVNTQTDPDFGYDPFTFTGESLVINAVPIPDALRGNLPPVCDEEDPSGLDRCEFLSGALSSHDRFQFIYGYTEGRFKVSGTPGALSSFYLYHRYAGNDQFHHAPEIDIIEYLGENPFGDPDAFQTYHFGDPNTKITRSAPTMSYKKPGGGFYADEGEWHTFGVLWEPQLVIWYIDGIEVKRLFGPQVSRQPMNIVNYLVTGSGWAPTPDITDASNFPIQFEADYIRVYQRDAFKSTVKFGP